LTFNLYVLYKIFSISDDKPSENGEKINPYVNNFWTNLVNMIYTNREMIVLTLNNFNTY
jgi:hypothetical protein